ncbi:MAG: glycoside hydrolase family 3 N-terminal domain-containing protein [Gemmatimonadaceae bacterium]|nr:glycoside hydrolase family 3 N-terminal domain-containing protein [Gemmatimonadaceae bacterium]
MTAEESRDPRQPLSPEAARWVDSTLASLSPRARAAQLIHVWLLGDYESETDSAFAETARWVRQDGIGGILMSVGSPIEVAVKLNTLQAMARVPLLVGCDVEPSIGRLEGGLFIPSMLKGGSATLLPTNMAIGATGDTALAYRAGLVTGRESRAIGIHLAYAPVADVNNNAANPVINVRSFGEDPAQVAAMVAAFTRGVQDGGALATVKHFPGHGDTETDSHNALPVVRLTHARLDSVELRPFRASINAGVAAVMSAHISNPTWLGDALPATLQRRVLHAELRDSLHFRGLTITDALTMQGVARRLLAGGDRHPLGGGGRGGPAEAGRCHAGAECTRGACRRRCGVRRADRCGRPQESRDEGAGRSASRGADVARLAAPRRRHRQPPRRGARNRRTRRDRPA